MNNQDDTRRVLPLAIAAHATERPDKIFLQEMGGRTLTFAQTHREALCWAGVFRRAGVAAGEPVTSMFPNCASCITAWLGIAWIGAIEAPVHTAYHGDMLVYIFNYTGARVAVISETFLSTVVDVADKLEHLERLILVPEGNAKAVEIPAGLPFRCDLSSDLLGEPLEVADCLVPEEKTVGTIIYTSGTTGNSKGVMVPWGQLWQTADGLDPLNDIGNLDIFYCPLPLFHNGGKSVISLMGLRGGTIVLRDKFSTSEFWDDILKFNCTCAMLIGSMTAFLEARQPKTGDADNPLRNVYPVPLPADPQGFAQRFGVRLHAWFGMSECGIPISALDWKPDRNTGCGQPRPGFQCRIVDGDDRDLPEGEIGELVLRSDSPWMMNRGYWKMPEKTVESWQNLWFHTGDAMYRDPSGNFHFVDRLKDAIRRRGENISSIEVERFINEHPAVLESAAVGTESRWGEQEVLAVVVMREGQSVEPSSLFEFLKQRMPRFMLPRYIQFLPELPRTPTGKVRKIELRGKLSADAWDSEGDRPGSNG